MAAPDESAIRRFFQDHPEELTCPGPNGDFRLHGAVYTNCEVTVRIMLEMGMHHPESRSQIVDSTNAHLDTPLHTAAAYGRDHLVALLLRFGSKAIRQPNKLGASPLACAAVHGRVSTLELLLQHDATPDFEWVFSWSGLTRAIVCFLANGDEIITILKAIGVGISMCADLTPEQSTRLCAPLPIDTITHIRNRIYFDQSLVSRLLFWL